MIGVLLGSPKVLAGLVVAAAIGLWLVWRRSGKLLGDGVFKMADEDAEKSIGEALGSADWYQKQGEAREKDADALRDARPDGDSGNR